MTLWWRCYWCCSWSRTFPRQQRRRLQCTMSPLGLISVQDGVSRYMYPQNKYQIFANVQKPFVAYDIFLFTYASSSYLRMFDLHKRLAYFLSFIQYAIQPPTNSDKNEIDYRASNMLWLKRRTIIVRDLNKTSFLPFILFRTTWFLINSIMKLLLSITFEILVENVKSNDFLHENYSFY